MALAVKNPLVNAGEIRDSGSISGSGSPRQGGAWQPTPVFLPGEFHGQRSLVGYGSWGHKELDTTEDTQHAHTCHLEIE